MRAAWIGATLGMAVSGCAGVADRIAQHAAAQEHRAVLTLGERALATDGDLAAAEREEVEELIEQARFELACADGLVESCAGYAETPGPRRDAAAVALRAAEVRYS